MLWISPSVSTIFVATIAKLIYRDDLNCVILIVNIEIKNWWKLCSEERYKKVINWWMPVPELWSPYFLYIIQCFHFHQFPSLQDPLRVFTLDDRQWHSKSTERPDEFSTNYFFFFILILIYGAIKSKWLRCYAIQIKRNFSAEMHL